MSRRTLFLSSLSLMLFLALVAFAVGYWQGAAALEGDPGRKVAPEDQPDLKVKGGPNPMVAPEGDPGRKVAPEDAPDPKVKNRTIWDVAPEEQLEPSVKEHPGRKVAPEDDPNPAFGG